MNIDKGLETPRARPLSAGLWTLLSWLRREEHSSNDSLSSVGSDGTAVSFAFLAPPPPRLRTAGVPLTSVSPPTDSYRKRVHERNERRQHDRDLTLRSKYGLYRADNGYDALTLPSTRRSLIDNSDKENRERRATSESFERRTAYVPGKRRAPLPPTFTATHPTSLTRRRTTRKRPAPKPPVKLGDQPKKSENKDTLSTPPLMNSKSGHENPLTNHTSNKCKLQKYNKKDDQAKDNTKNRTEKSFLKLLFESKKRNSTLETVPERLLPSISELDKQAAAIIESCKLKTLNENDPNGSSSHIQSWFCTKCLRKYDSTVVSCTNCLSLQKINFNGFDPEGKNLHSKPSDAYSQTQYAASPIEVGSSSRGGVETKEKQKLKEMLKEMKNSLPKRPKHDSNERITIKNTTERNVTTLETPTLRIGSTLSDEIKELKLNPGPCSSKKVVATDGVGFNTGSKESGELKPNVIETVIITQHVVLLEPPPRDESNKLSKPNDVHSRKTNEIKSNESSISSNDLNLHTPLKISSLLNPIYVPKSSTENQVRKTLFFTQADAQARQTQIAEKQTSEIITNVTMPSTANISANKLNELEEFRKMKMVLSNDVKSQEKEKKNPSLNSTSMSLNESNLSQKVPGQKSRLKGKDNVFTPLISDPSVSNSSSSNNVNVRLTVEQHSRRRELINQLEKSIAKGDESAAADAAMKLAQLRLSCSVLSFSSQIVGESSKPSLNPVQNIPNVSSNQNNLKTPSTVAKVNAAVQSMEIVSLKQISKNKDETTVKEQKLIYPTPSSKIATKSQETKQNTFNKTKIRRELPKQIEEPSTSNPTAKERTGDLRT